MAKEWILNQSMNRWGLNKKTSVGSVSELIRKCSPRTVEDWEKYYYANVYSQQHLVELGQKLYIKITEVIQSEVAEVTEEDCINYIKEVVIKRTFDGYQTEIQTIYGQLQQYIPLHIAPAPDEWDRLYNVDFSIEVNKKYIGLQIKPTSFEHTPEHQRWEKIQETTHKKFEKKYGGRVFTIFSIKEGKNKKIVNPEVIEEIQKEIERLSA